jgi:hypothetical protein
VEVLIQASRHEAGGIDIRAHHSDQLDDPKLVHRSGQQRDVRG